MATKSKTYKVGSDGKAPSGLKVGDDVVTGGGTYRITGVNADGSYKSAKVGSATTSTYKGTYANSGSSGGSIGGTTTTTGNSYSPTATGGTQSVSGATWNANTDYSKLIADAVAKGDYKAAAQYEQLRNQKITATGSNYATTNRFSGWLDNTDYSTIGAQQMASGASADEIYDTIMKRYNKSAYTEGLQQYANDDLQKQMWDYYYKALQNEAGAAADDYMEGFEYDEEKPTYESQYDPAIQALLNQILNRDDFSYSAQNDPLYQQYAAMYNREGDRAMRDAMAEAAASAGGMNSYAVTAAQQANNYYSSQLNDKIPELYQLAYEMYLQDKESKVQDLGVLQNLDATQYNRYRDTMSDYYNDKNFAYGMYQDAVAQGNWQQTFDYNKSVDDRNFYFNSAQSAIDNEWRNKEWDNTLNQQNIQNNRYDAEVKRDENAAAKAQAREEVFALLELGQMPPTALLEAAGIDEAYANAYLKGVLAQMNKTTGGSLGRSGGSGGSSSSNESEDSDDSLWEAEDDGEDDTGSWSILDLGLGPISNETLEEIFVYGGLVGDKDGNLYWADGWNAKNYREKIEQNKTTGIFMNRLF